MKNIRLIVNIASEEENSIFFSYALEKLLYNTFNKVDIIKPYDLIEKYLSL